MSDTKPEASITGNPPAEKPSVSPAPSTASTTPTAASTNVKPVDSKPVKSKGYSNPALKAMGISTLRLPSRNWSIFWLVVSGVAGGIVYDRYQQSKIRERLMTRVSKYGEVPLQPNQLARKVTVFVAPPPSDYLDESLAVFRKYVKPILNAGGVDYEIKSENRQGVIRSLVAADIRSLRREILKNQEELKKLEQDAKWYNRLRNLFKRKSKSSDDVTKNELILKQKKDEFDYSKLIGVYYENSHISDEVVSEDAVVVDSSANGGVICIGRGAYKEYLTGLHEGLLGPLEKPLENNEFEQYNNTKAEQEITEEKKAEEVFPPAVKKLDDLETELSSKDENAIEKTEVTKIDDGSTKPDDSKEEEKKKDADDDDTSDDEGDKKPPIPKPFILPQDYSTASLAPELNLNSKIPTKDSVAPIFQQPIMVIPVYHLLGFLSTPQRIYRFYTRRYLTEEFGLRTVALVENHYRPFIAEDVDLAKSEESDWPKKWVEKGLEKNSEWVQELKTDDRVLKTLKVYDYRNDSD